MPYTRAQMMESRAEGRKLTEALSKAGSQIQSPFRSSCSGGKAATRTTARRLWQYLEGDGTYIHKSRRRFRPAGGGPRAGTAIGNSARKSSAAREAAARFRPVDQGQLYLTDRRFAVQGQAQWTDLWFDELRMSSCDGSSITLHMSGLPPMQMHTWPIDYYFALFHFLSTGNIIQIPADPN